MSIRVSLKIPTMGIEDEPFKLANSRPQECPFLEICPGQPLMNVPTTNIPGIEGIDYQRITHPNDLPDALSAGKAPKYTASSKAMPHNMHIFMQGLMRYRSA
jgi:hypothetical protein